MNELVIIIIVIAFLSLVLTFLLTFIVKKTNGLVKSIYVDRMSEFDFLLDDKEKKVNELNDDIRKKTELISQLEEKTKEYDNNNNSIKKNDVVMPMFVGFEDTSTFNNYRVIKERFNYDPTDVIKKFILENSSDNNNLYQILKEVRGYFTFDVIYKIGLYQPQEQYEIVTSLLNNNELNVLKSYLHKDKFDLKKFIEELDDLIIKTDPEIKVLVGDKESNYDNLGKNVTTCYDKKITEGFKIIYKGVIYDYSI